MRDRVGRLGRLGDERVAFLVADIVAVGDLGNLAARQADVGQDAIVETFELEERAAALVPGLDATEQRLEAGPDRAETIGGNW